jgi:hypothetical protein
MNAREIKPMLEIPIITSQRILKLSANAWRTWSCKSGARCGRVGIAEYANETPVGSWAMKAGGNLVVSRFWRIEPPMATPTV